MSKSLYAQFKEELYPETTVLESQTGFVEYKINGDQLYIVNAYSVKEVRGQGELKKLLGIVTQRGKEKGCKYLLTSLEPSHSNAKAALNVILALGGEPLAASDGLMFFIREI